MNPKLAFALALLIIVCAFGWHRVRVPWIRWTPAPQESEPVGVTLEAELRVTKDGEYLLDGNPVAPGELKLRMDNLQATKPGARVFVVAATGAPLPAVAAAIGAVKAAGLTAEGD